MVQEYLNEISPTMHGPNKLKTSWKPLRIADLQPPASGQDNPATLYSSPKVTYTYSDLKMIYSDPRVTYSHSNVTYSDPKVTHSDPTHLPLPTPTSPGHHLAKS